MTRNKKIIIILIILIVLVGIWFGWKFLINSEEPVACTMDAKLCSDGSYVGRVAPGCDFALCPKEDLIQVESLQANDTITSPLVIKGKTRGYWFFEASFPIRLYDDNGELLATAIAQAQDDWMTEEFVPFTAELKFENPKTEKGTLVLEKDNPSGLPENADELRIPVIIKSVPKVNFIESGNLVINNPGLKPGVWYLVYEKPGQPAISTELNFDDQSICHIEESSQPCLSSHLQFSERVYIEGLESDNVVLVRKLTAKENANQQYRTIKLYYYNPESDKDESGNVMCSRNGLVSVDREVAVTKTPIQDAIKLLLSGQITEQEKSQGIDTEYPLDGFSLKGAYLKDGVLTLEFSDPNNKSVGGSCRVGVLWFQIEATAKQFPEVQQVRFLPEDIFQP